ncbi:MFS transporter [Asanoa sp. NPDC049518]|uniref:MFS transporter n=1 Tax=unclassified Asanoa TaxID=2685164 RepID=UPI00341EC6CC
MTTTATPVAAGPGAARPRSRSLAWVLVAVGVPMFMVTLDNLVVTTALPVIKTEIGASLSDLSWFVNAYTLPFAALLLTAAAIGDRVGRRRLFVLGIALFTFASAACALATEPWMLTTARAVQGVGGAMVMPLSLTLLAAAVPEKMRNAAIGIWGGISGLGVAVGPVVGGAVAEGLHWTWIFWLNVPIGVLAVVVVWLVLTESRGSAKRLDPLGLVLVSLGMFGLIWGVVHGSDDGWTSLSVLGTLVGGFLLLVAFVAWERRAPEPMLPPRLFRSRGFSVVNVVAFLFSVGAFGSVFLLAQFFQVVQGLGPFGSGVRTLPWTAAPMVAAPLAGLLVGRVGSRVLIVLGQVLLGAGLLWIALSSTVDVGYGSLVPAFVLAGLGMGLTFAPLSTVALGSVEAGSEGMASGTLNMVREFGVAVGVAALASVFASQGSYTSGTSYVDGLVPAVLVGAAVVGAAALAGLLLPGRRYLTTPNSPH